MINLKPLIDKPTYEIKDSLYRDYPSSKDVIDLIVKIINSNTYKELKELKEIDCEIFSSIVNDYDDSVNAEIALYTILKALDIKFVPKVIPEFEKEEEIVDDVASKNLVKKEVVHEHKYVPIDIPSTCKENGYTLYRCEECGKEYKDNYKQNKDHYFIQCDYIAPTCTNAGKVVKECVYCGEIKEETIQALGHNFTDEVIFDYETCTKPGKKKKTCSICGKEIYEDIPATGHDFTKWVEDTRPTCTEPGLSIRACNKCEIRETKEIEPLGHSFSKWIDDGDKKRRQCTRCNYTEYISKKQIRKKFFLASIICTIILILIGLIIGVTNTTSFYIRFSKYKQLAKKIGDAETFVIPDGVTKIGDFAFFECKSLKTVIIPDSVKKIGVAAFKECSSLESITIPDSVKSIGYDAFYGCTSLTNIELSNSITTIETGTFRGCTSLKNITIPNSVTTINGCPFMWCSSLKMILIPNNVTTINADAFYQCTLTIFCEAGSKPDGWYDGWNSGNRVVWGYTG